MSKQMIKSLAVAVAVAVAVAGVAVATASPALAHTGHLTSGLGAGLAHPLLGADHLVAMLAVGLWSAGQQKGAAWHGPAVFLALLVAGTCWGAVTAPIQIVEAGILVSVFALAGLIVMGRRVPVPLAMTLIGVFALLHGQAHGAEAPLGAAWFVVGMLVASTGLHLAGYIIGRIFAGTRFGLASSGVLVVSAGLLMAAG